MPTLQGQGIDGEVVVVAGISFLEIIHEELQRLVIEAVQWLRDSTVVVIVARYQTDFESPATSLRRLRF